MNPASLQNQLRELREQVALLQEALEQSRRENTLLRQKLDALARRFFGKKSEQLNAAQLELLLSGLAEGNGELSEEKEPPARLAPRHARTPTRRIRTPDNLEVVREVIEPELVKAEPEHWKRIGQEVRRQLDYQPGKFFWQETVRPKYVRRDQRALPPMIAPAPERVAERSLAAPGLLAQLLVGKYCDHLPFYRQEQIFWQRHGVFIARQQMVQWTAQSVRLLSGISDCLKREMQRRPYVQVDETPVRYQDPNLPGRCGQGYLWTGLVPGQCVVYEWHASRAARCLDSLLGPGFAGKLQCDGYSADPAFAKEKTTLTLFGCWAHARRNFFEAQEQAPRVAGWMLNQIGLLYRWEEELRRNRAGPVLRQVQHLKDVLERLPHTTNREVDQLTPLKWKQARQSALKQAA